MVTTEVDSFITSTMKRRIHENDLAGVIQNNPIWFEKNDLELKKTTNVSENYNFKEPSNKLRSESTNNPVGNII